MEQNIIAVSQVNEYIKFLLDRDELLGNICVRGELSNYKVYPSGHHYFTLKDAEGALRCVMFRSSAQRLRFRPENGMQVIASGRVTVFPRDGAYQLYCNTLTADGAGDLYVAFEQLKEKLGEGVVVLLSEQDGRVNIVAMATEEAQKKGAHAGNLIKAIAGKVGGGGGGRPNMAQAGGKNPAGIPDAIAEAKAALEVMLG